MTTFMGEKKWQGTVVAAFAMGAVAGAIKGSAAAGTQVALPAAAFACTANYLGTTIFQVPQTERNIRRWRVLPETSEPE